MKRFALSINQMFFTTISIQIVIASVTLGALIGIIHVQHVQNINHQYTNQTLTEIQKEMICIGAFFDQPGQVRSTGSIATLKACQPALKEQQ